MPGLRHVPEEITVPSPLQACRDSFSPAAGFKPATLAGGRFHSLGETVSAVDWPSTLRLRAPGVTTSRNLHQFAAIGQTTTRQARQAPRWE